MLTNPAITFVVVGLLIAVSPQLLRRPLTLLTPAIALWQLLLMPDHLAQSIRIFGYVLQPLRLDSLSFVFALIFIIVSFIVALFSLHKNSRIEQSTIHLYAGASLGAVFSGDLASLFIFFEVSTIASAILIYLGNTRQSSSAALRYFLIHVLAGLLLLTGTLLQYNATQSLAFERMQLGSLSSWLIFLAFGIKCAFPLLHNWLQDTYPRASAVGTVALSAFTTKLAIYCLARGFAGTEALIWIGATMTAFPIFFAVIENDLRKVLSYSLNNQLGFMVVGIGVGTELSLNGTAAHAFCHILYKALLFMSMGAVLHQVGTTKASLLGGLHKSMPWTTAFCIVGSMSISAFPLFSGFISKGIILFATAEQGHWITWLVLLFASAGVLDHSGIKIPFFTFFAHDAGYRCKEAPLNMLIAMGLTAAICIGLGIYPSILYHILPFPMTFHPYSFDHVITQLQLLFFALLAFIFLYRTGRYPAEIDAINLDTDWIYRKLMNQVMNFVFHLFDKLLAILNLWTIATSEGISLALKRYHGPSSILARGVPVGTMVMWVALLLSACLIFYYL